jgi:hypothetical protein
MLVPESQQVELGRLKWYSMIVVSKILPDLKDVFNITQPIPELLRVSTFPPQPLLEQQVLIGWLKKQINTSNAHVCLFQQLTCPISIMIFASEEIPTCVPFALLEALLVLMSSLIKAHLD